MEEKWREIDSDLSGDEDEDSKEDQKDVQIVPKLA
jgi:hypothetical protein